MNAIKAIVMKPIDNVATVVEAQARGNEVTIDRSGSLETVTVLDDIPFAHKFAIRDIVQGDSIVKYGEVIGIATRPIKKGEYVHVHNLESCRGRGDHPDKPGKENPDG